MKPLVESPIQMSWLDMAREGLSSPELSPEVVGYFPYPIRASIDHGRRIKAQLDLMPEEARKSFFYIVYQAVSLRFYLAACEGRLDGLKSHYAASIVLGMCDDDGNIKEEWK